MEYLQLSRHTGGVGSSTAEIAGASTPRDGATRRRETGRQGDRETGRGRGVHRMAEGKKKVRRHTRTKHHAHACTRTSIESIKQSFDHERDDGIIHNHRNDDRKGRRHTSINTLHARARVWCASVCQHPDGGRPREWNRECVRLRRTPRIRARAGDEGDGVGVVTDACAHPCADFVRPCLLHTRTTMNERNG